MIKVIEINGVISLQPPVGFAYCQEVDIKNTKGIQLVNMDKNSINTSFAQVVYASDEDKELVGKVVVVEHWKKVPITLPDGRKLIGVDVKEPTLVKVDGKNIGGEI